MADVKHVATFDAAAFRTTVADMHVRGEKAHDRGERVYDATGQLDPLVNIFGQTRVSHNALISEGDVFRLVHGPKLPILFATDGTGSMGKNVAKAFYAMEIIDAMLAPLRNRYQTDLSFAVMQDVGDPHPVFQMPQWESDQRFADHVRLLVPDKSGGDAPEDYDQGLAYVWMASQTDIHDFYSLRGYFLIVGDQIGRGQVYPDDVKRHLGHNLQSVVSTRKICQALLEKWHLYFVQVGSGGGAIHNEVTSWWKDKLGKGRVMIVPNPDLLAEVQAGLVYVVETAQPSLDGLTQFLSAGGANRRIGQNEIRDVWNWLQDARSHFGAQTMLPGHKDLPKPGDVFAHYRHAWPIGHPRAGENVTPEGETPTRPAEPTKTPKSSKLIDWSKL